MIPKRWRPRSFEWVVIEMGCAMVRGRMGCSVVASGDEEHMKTGRIARHMG